MHMLTLEYSSLLSSRMVHNTRPVVFDLRNTHPNQMAGDINNDPAMHVP